MPAKQGSFANANGMLIFEDDLKEVCYASLHSEPTSVLGLTTVWSLWRKTGMARCQDTVVCKRVGMKSFSKF